MAGEIVQFASNGHLVEGYLARSVNGTGPGVIVLQEWWGLVGHIKSVVDRFAAAGFTALAPDLYEGESTSDPDEAGKLMMALNMEATEKTLRGAVDRLLNDEGCSSSKVGIVGFCMGGQLALFAACANSKIGACVDFYGVHPSARPDFASLKAPVLGFFAEHDAFVNGEVVAKLDADLTAHGVEHEFQTFAGTQHAFFNDDRPQVYDAAAAGEAWEKMVGFFRARLGD
jgi:carboxymethylenebutenolidase